MNKKQWIAAGMTLACALCLPVSLQAANDEEADVYIVTEPVPEEAIRFARDAMDTMTDNYYRSDDPKAQMYAAANVSLGNGFYLYSDDKEAGSTECYRFPVYHGEDILYYMDVFRGNEGKWAVNGSNGPNFTNGGMSELKDKPGTYRMVYKQPMQPLTIEKVADDYKVDAVTEKSKLYPAVDDRNQASYRLYNPNSGEHFYTQDQYERDVLYRQGWYKEGTGWYSPIEGEAVFRLYNPNSGEHHYTLDSNEASTLAKLGWKEEGTAFNSGTAKKVPVYRLFNPAARDAGSHHYTTQESEKDTLVKAGWSYEGIGWYADLGGWQFEKPEIYANLSSDDRALFDQFFSRYSK